MSPSEAHRVVRYQQEDQRRQSGVLIESDVYRLEGWKSREPVIGPYVAPLDQVQLLAPTTPSKIVAVGRNYAAHAAEHGSEVPTEPLFFLKPPSSVIGPGEAIIYPALSRQVEHEGELAVVIGRQARGVPEVEALNYVLGYTCALDMTARDLQGKDGQWTRAKGFDTFCPVGPWIVTNLDVADLEIQCRVNGEVRQKARTSLLVFPVPHLIARASEVMTLEPGDLLLTGTPAGVSPVAPGDRIEVEIEGIGVLRNHMATPDAN